MNRFAQLPLLAALTISSAAFGQPADMKGMDMNKGCMNMQEMKGMNMAACKDAMEKKHVHSKGRASTPAGVIHKTSAMVKTVDAANGKVTLAHGPVATLNWPSMTMSFSVRDRSLLNKLTVGKKVNVEFIQRGSDYVVTAVK